MVERILNLVEARGITARKLSAELGLSNSAVTDWKKGRGKPSADTVVRLAEFFGVSTDYILRGKENVETGNEDIIKEIEEIERHIEEIASHIQGLKERLEGPFMEPFTGPFSFQITDDTDENDEDKVANPGEAVLNKIEKNEEPTPGRNM